MSISMTLNPKWKKIANYSLTITQAIILSTSTHTLILLIYPQCDIGVSINGCGDYCVVEAEIKNSTCNELAINILLHCGWYFLSQLKRNT